MVKREGRLLTTEEHRGAMAEVRQGFLLARNVVGDAVLDHGINLKSHEVFLGLLILGSMGAGVSDKIKPPRTDSDTDISPVISNLLTDDMQHMMARVFFDCLNHNVFDLDRYFQPTSCSNIGLKWTLSGVYRYHDGVTLVAKKDSDLHLMSKDISEKNKIQLNLIEI